MQRDIEDIAAEVDEEISDAIREQGHQMGLETELVDYLAENAVILVVEPEVSEFVYNREQPVSLKAGNMLVDLRALLRSIAELFVGWQNPDSRLNIARMLIWIILSIKDVAQVKLPQYAGEILMVLCQNNGYVRPLEESALFELLGEMIQKEVDRETFGKTLVFLDKYAVVELRNGAILLKEKVFGKDFA